LIVLAGCEGDQGPVGPAGPAGNANVKSGTVAPTNAEWLWNSVYTLKESTGQTTSYFTRHVDVAVPQITAEIIANGAVLVFFEPLPGSGRWAPLNYSFLAFGGEYFHNYVYEATRYRERARLNADPMPPWTHAIIQAWPAISSISFSISSSA
jgi:hypothetical protein